MDLNLKRGQLQLLGLDQISISYYSRRHITINHASSGAGDLIYQAELHRKVQIAQASSECFADILALPTDA